MSVLAQIDAGLPGFQRLTQVALSRTMHDSSLRHATEFPDRS